MVKTNTKIFDIMKLPEDLSKKVIHDTVMSPTLNLRTLNTLAKTNKEMNQDLMQQMYIAKHKNIRKFTKYQNIGNILPIVAKSIFSYEELIDI